MDDGGELRMNVTTTDEARSEWTMNADAYALDLVDRGLRARFLRVRGLCDASGPEVGPTPAWLWGVQGPITPYLDATQLWVDDGTSEGGGVRQTTLEGAIDGLAAVAGGAAYDTVDFVDVTMAAEALGAACAREPSGRIEVRDDEGNRWPLSYPSGDCDGCAELLDAGGASLGEVCTDFSPLSRPLMPPVDP